MKKEKRRCVPLPLCVCADGRRDDAAAEPLDRPQHPGCDADQVKPVRGFSDRLVLMSVWLTNGGNPAHFSPSECSVFRRGSAQREKCVVLTRSLCFWSFFKAPPRRWALTRAATGVCFRHFCVLATKRPLRREGVGQCFARMTGLRASASSTWRVYDDFKEFRILFYRILKLSWL